MGNSNNTEQTQGIEYIRSIEDAKFGTVELYKRNEIEYIMKKTFTFVNCDTISERIRNCLTFMQKHKHSSLAPLHQLRICKESHLCIEYQRCQLYVDYYNYTFGNIIETQKVLEVGELWYTINSLADLGTVLVANNIQVNPFTVDTVFVSLKGVPCVYLIDAEVIEEGATLGQALALVIMSLVTLKKVEVKESYEEELGIVGRKSQEMRELLEKMINDQIKFEEVLGVIDKLIAKGKIKLANSLRLSKFKALIPISHLPIKQNPDPIHNYNSQPSSNPTQANTTSKTDIHPITKPEIKPPPLLIRPIQSLKQLEQRKNQDRQQQKRMRQRMQKFLGKENLSVNRTTTQNSEKKHNRKPNSTVMSRPSALNRKAAFL